MADWTPIPLATEPFVTESSPPTVRRPVNMYVEPQPQEAKSPFKLLPRPGLKPWVSAGDGPCRGLIIMGDYLYVVSGEELYRVAKDGTATLLGAIPGTRDCFLTENGFHVGIAADASVFAANGDGVAEVAVARMVGAAAQDGYGIFAEQGGERFFIAGPDDMTIIEALDFSTADSAPDSIVGVISDHRELVLVGERSTEFWVDTGAAAFPFERAGFLELGCAAPGSLAKALHRVIWLDHNLQVSATSGGYQAAPVSTPAIDLLVRAVGDPASARGFTFTLGHTFYVLNFATLSLVYDMTTGKWATAETFNEDRWRAHHAAYFGSKSIVGDFETGQLYELDAETYSDDGVANLYRFTSGEVHADGRGLFMAEALLEAEAGVGNAVAPDDDPSIFLRCSDDGGRTWSNPREAKLGKRGVYDQQVTWNRLGRAKRSRILEFSTRAGVKVAASGCKARLEVAS